MLEEINQLRDQLSRAERRVADQVLAHPRDTMSSNLAMLARRAKTSEPTVVRFCRSVGASGFSDFKLRIAADLSRPPNYLHRDVTADDSVSDAVMKVMDRSVQAIMAARDEARSLPFEASVEVMRRARQWIFCGLGASGQVAQDAAQKYFRLGVPCSARIDSPSIAQTAAVLEPGDVLILISHTGRWQDLVEASELAQEHGAEVIAVTAPESALAASAQLTLSCAVSEDASLYTPMSSRLAHLALLDALHVALALALGESATIKLRRSKKALGTA